MVESDPLIRTFVSRTTRSRVRLEPEGRYGHPILVNSGRSESVTRGDEPSA